MPQLGGGAVLEELRAMLKPTESWVAVAQITQLALAADRSVWRAKCSVFPEGHEVIARMSWGQVGPDSGIFGPATVGDMVLIAFAEGTEDQAFVIGRLSSKEDKIPAQAGEGHNIMKALAGKKLYLSSDTRILLGLGTHGADPDEPLVLGNVMRDLMSAFLAECSTMAESIKDHKHICSPPGYLSQTPDNESDFGDNADNFDAFKATPVDDNLMNSDLVFTEKG